MSDIFEITEISMINDMQRLKTISNNLANVSTSGFKRDIVVSESFESRFQAEQEKAANAQAASRSAILGDMTTITDVQQGSFKYSGNTLDVAIEGDGYFQVEKNSQTWLTRQGTFSVDGQGRLVTAGGLLVKGSNGEVRLTTTQPVIDKQGRIWEGADMVGQLELVKLTQDAQLLHVGGSLYKSSVDKLEKIPLLETSVRQGYIEASNVKSMDEMVKMIDVMRHFETSQKVLKSYDELLENSIRTIGDL